MKTQRKIITITIIAFLMGLILGLIILLAQNNILKENNKVITEEQQIKIIKQIQQESDGLEYYTSSNKNPIKPRPNPRWIKDLNQIKLTD